MIMFPKGAKVIVHCRSGRRSVPVTEQFKVLVKMLIIMKVDLRDGKQNSPVELFNKNDNIFQ